VKIEFNTFTLSADQTEQLEQFLAILSRWNKTHNLTAIKDRQSMLSHHLYDSLSIHDFLSGNRIADVGSGGGLPGIPLAVINPERQFTLIESNAKKVGFLRQAAIELGLKNVTAIHSRVQDYLPEQQFDQVMSRAFAAIPDFVAQSQHLLRKEGVWLAMKGQLPAQELTALAAKFEYTVDELAVPELQAARHLITIKNK